MIKYSFIKKIEGHKNSKGENAPWCIVSEKDPGKILSSHTNKQDAESHLKDINIHKANLEIINLNSELYLVKSIDEVE